MDYRHYPRHRADVLLFADSPVSILFALIERTKGVESISTSKHVKVTCKAMLIGKVANDSASRHKRGESSPRDTSSDRRKMN